MQLLRLNKIDKLYNTIKHKKGSALIDSLIEKLEVKFDINPKDLTNIPTKGAFISIANHPFGGIDGLLLLKFFLDVRPDFKILQNRSLKKITPLSDSFVVLNPKNNIQNTQTDIDRKSVV